MLENKLNFINLHEHPEYDMDIEGLNEYVFPGTLATTSLDKDTLEHYISGQRYLGYYLSQVPPSNGRKSLSYQPRRFLNQCQI